MKAQRWYDVTTEENGQKTLNVYDHPDKAKAQGVSMVSIEGLQYYRNNFKLSKVWTQEEIKRNESLQSF